MISRSQRMMLLVLACLLPGVIVSTLLFGIGSLSNLVVAAASIFIVECLVARLRHKPIALAWDGSGFVTALLFALCLPPNLDPWIVAFGAASAILLGKHLYGGLGHNPFNPAMVGYCIVILSFPLQLSTWPALADGLSGATALDTLKFREGQTIEEIWTTQNGFGSIGGYGIEWLNLAFLVGGLILIAVNAARWQASLTFLLSLVILSSVFYDSGSSSSLGSPLFHLFSGGTMLAAFFILTDPATSPDTTKGLLLFGAAIGALTFLIRSIGAYPDGIAFSVLLINALVPLYEQVRKR